MRLKYLQLLFVMLLTFGQLAYHSPLHAQMIDPDGIPDEIRSCLRSNAGLQLDGGTNPYYLTGDFDGDGMIDFAVLVRNSKDRGAGIHRILFCFAQGRSVLWDAGEHANEASPFTAWFLVTKQSTTISIPKDQA